MGESSNGVEGPHGVIDVGSNTVHLLVGWVEDGMVMPVTGEKVSARLGKGVGKTRRIEPERMAVAVEAIRLYARISALNGAPEPLILATSAVREAENGPVLVEMVRMETGIEMKLISGEEEALLGFRGAISAAGVESWRTPGLMVDLGGGSAQLVFGEASEGPSERVSLPLGSNRMTEKFVEKDPPVSRELRRIREYVPGLLPDWELPEEAPFFAIGGSARAILKVTRDRLTAERLYDFAEDITAVPSAVLSRENGLTPERARVLPAAVTTLAAMLEHFGKPELSVVRGGLREGAILTRAGAVSREGV